jgi:hypothetical protein
LLAIPQILLPLPRFITRRSRRESRAPTSNWLRAWFAVYLFYARNIYVAPL